LAELFRENGIAYDQVNYFNEPLDEKRLRSLVKKLGIPAFGLLRTKEKEFKELGFTEATPESDILAAIVANPGLLNRPIVEVGDKAVIARPIGRALELLSKA
jgi:arsenate reductase (glutaredoxin)